MLVRPLTPRARVAATAPGESASFRAWSVVTRRGWGVKRRREAEEGTLKPTHESDGLSHELMAPMGTQRVTCGSALHSLSTRPNILLICSPPQ